MDNTAAANNANRLRDASAVTLSGGTLAFSHDGGAANFSETVGAVTVSVAANTISATQAGDSQTSTFTLTSLSRTGGTLNFVGVGLGESDRNRIKIQSGTADGLIGTWATVNGTHYAAYSSADGVYASSLTVANITVRGSTIDDNAAAAAVINEDSGTGSITLAGATENSVFRLRQETDAVAVVATAGKTLKAASVEIASGGGALTLGENQGDGALAPLAAGGALALRNDSATSVLTVKAAVANNGTSTLEKLGGGKALLTASNTFSGVTWVRGGTLAFGGAVTQTLAGVVNGAGALAMEGSGRLTLSGANTYTGVTVVSSGTLVAQNSNALGAKSAGTVVQSGAALDLGGTLGANALYLGDEPVTVSGTGPDGRGAVINSSANNQYNALTKLALAGDTTFGGEHANARWDIRTTANGSKATFDMNGYTVTKVGTNTIGLTAVEVNPGAAGSIDLQQGLFTVEVGTRLNGGSANTFTVRGGATFDIYSLYYPILWSLAMEDNSRFYVRQGNNIYQNFWDGPVTLNGRSVFDMGGGSATVRGNIGGSGSLVKIGGSTLYLRGTNTYAGTTTVSNGTFYAQTAASLAGYNDGRFTLLGGATLWLHTLGDGIGWNAEQIRDLHDASTFVANSAVLNIDTTFGSLDYPHTLSKAVSITKQGNNTLTLSGPFITQNALRAYGGETRFTGSAASLPGTVMVGTGTLTLDGNSFVEIKSNTCYVGEGAAHFGRMTVKNNAGWSGFLYPYNVGQSSLVVGQSGRGILTIQDNACVTQRLVVGNNGGSAGAVYQNGGRMHNWGGAASDPRVGETGYGYYELNSGTFTNNGYFQVGRNLTGVGIIRQTGGVFEMGTVYNGQLGISRGGTGVVVLAGGTFATGPSPLNANPTIDIGNASDNSTTKGFAELTLDGTADADANAYINIGDRWSMFACLNLNGGRLTAKYVQRANRTNTVGLVNFDGGTFRSRQSGNVFSTGANAPTAVNIYGGGATFDTATNICTIAVPLLAPPGQGVTGLYVPPTRGYIGPPMVCIDGGGGTGATAVATFDSASGTLTGIEMTSRGYGYTSAPTVTLSGGGTNFHPAVTGLTLTQNTSGGLTKLGSGTLTLSSTNTYGGATTVQNGTLKLALQQSLPTGSDLNVEAGVLDLGGFAVTGGAVNAASGLLGNGALVSDSLTKTGDGTFILGVPLALQAPLVVEGGVLNVRRAGLWEGAIWGAFQTTSNNPATAVQMTTRMANTTAGWPTNTTYMYSGTIWNRSSEPVTWTFAENVDDNVYLKIDSTVMMTNGITWNVPTFSTITLDPGPHRFEARFGQGGGGAGPVNSQWWKTTAFGFGVDFQGRSETNNLSYVPLVDPGDGSLLTLDGAGLTNQLDSSTVVLVADGAAIDFNSGVQTLASLGGAGTVSNCTLTVTGNLAPGGEGDIGTLALANTTLREGNLLVDVATDGSCDLLSVAGNLDVSGLTLEIANPGSLNVNKTYTVVTVSGTRTGAFASVTVPDTRWHVIYRSNGEIQLIFINGTLLKVR